jgi:serine/threonine-protein kinase
MPGKPSNLGRFWQELKRRRVIHVITVYASAAFVIIELVGNLAEPLNLPEKLPIIVIIVLAVGFPLAVILSWLYDLTSEGVERTKPLSEVKEGGKPVVPHAWKIATYVSFVVILGLVTLNIVDGSKQLRAGDIQSLVILPFENFTGDEGLEYFVSGMHSSLIGEMGKIGKLRVIGENSSNVYKDVDISAPQIAAELDVDAVVEPAVMCLGADSICVQLKLISIYPEEKQIWIAEFKEERSQILNFYPYVTKHIADEVMIELSDEEKRLMAGGKTVDKETYDAYMKGYHYLDRVGKEDLEKALEYYNTAIEKDPDWAPPYAGVARVWLRMQQMHFTTPNIARPKIYEYLDKALELDPDFADSHFLIGVIAYHVEWNWDKAEKEFLKALAINPNDAMLRVFYGHLLMCLQRSDEALMQGQLAAELDPLDPIILSLYAVVLSGVNNLEAAMAQVEKALTIDPENYFANSVMEEVALLCEDYDRAMEAGIFTSFFEEDVNKNIEKIYNEKGIDAAYEEVLRNWEVMAQDTSVPPLAVATCYYFMKQYDKAMDWLEKGYELHDPAMMYIGWSNSDSLYDNPRFIALLEKMNLPIPKD